MTIEELKRAVPRHSRGMITQNVVDVMNQLEGDQGIDFAEHYKQNFITLSKVMQSGEFSTTDYLNAIKFVSHKLLANSDIDSYQMTFPDRYERLLIKWQHLGDETLIRSAKISTFVTAYKQNALVAKVAEQALIPPRILNAPMFQEALNVQLELALTSGSDLVRTQAANSILVHLKQPETQHIALEIGVKGTDELEAMRREMRNLASAQKNSIEVGSNTSLEIAESRLMIEQPEDIIEGEINEEI